MKITALLDALNSALAEPFALAWSQDSPRFLLVFTVVYAVAVTVSSSRLQEMYALSDFLIMAFVMVSEAVT